jgi:hypothetical protein
MMDINKIIDDQMAAWARNDMIGMLADAGHALVQTGLQVNGARYQGVLVGPLLMRAAAALEECWKREGVIQNAAKPENPDDVVVKVTVPDRWPMTEAGQRWAAQESAAPVVHGQWIIGVDDDDFDVKCSRCEWTDIFEVAGIAAVERIAKTMHYCPNCGAKMDGGAENG